jgi:hypothetical protein
MPMDEWGRKHVTGRDMAAVIVLSMALPVILSAVGPFYYGYTHGPYWRVIVWALACTVSTLCFMRSSFKHMWDAEPGSVIGKLFSVAMAVIIVAVCLLVGNSAVYLLARAISSSSTSSFGTSAGLGYVILSVGVLWLLWSWSKWRMAAQLPKLAGLPRKRRSRT